MPNRPVRTQTFELDYDDIGTPALTPAWQAAVFVTATVIAGGAMAVYTLFS